MTKEMTKLYTPSLRRTTLLTASLTAMLLLSACSGMSERMSRIGKPVPMMEAGSYAAAQHQPVNVPMPPQTVEVRAPNSLWQSSRQTFFKDQRANKAGDILTVLIDIKDEAKLDNKTERTRAAGESAGLPHLLGLESYLDKAFPGAVDPSALAAATSGSNHTGDGTIDRKEDVKLKMAAMVTQVLPNGNFVIRGSQQVRVNNELRELLLDGIIRPEDILNNNSISYEKIAEARISYGGRGTLSDVQEPRYGQQFYDVVFPF